MITLMKLASQFHFYYFGYILNVAFKIGMTKLYFELKVVIVVYF